MSAEFDDLFVVIGRDAKTNAKIKKALVAKIANESDGPYKPRVKRKPKKEAQ